MAIYRSKKMIGYYRTRDHDGGIWDITLEPGTGWVLEAPYDYECSTTYTESPIFRTLRDCEHYASFGDRIE